MIRNRLHEVRLDHLARQSSLVQTLLASEHHEERIQQRLTAEDGDDDDDDDCRELRTSGCYSRAAARSSEKIVISAVDVVADEKVVLIIYFQVPYFFGNL